MNPMKEKRLEIKVIGVGEIKIIRNGSATLVYGGGLIQGEHYLMPFEDVKEMVFKRLDTYYPNKSRLITPTIY